MFVANGFENEVEHQVCGGDQCTFGVGRVVSKVWSLCETLRERSGEAINILTHSSRPRMIRANHTEAAARIEGGADNKRHSKH